MNKSRWLSRQIVFYAFSFLCITASFLTIQAAGEVDRTFNAAIQSNSVNSNNSAVKSIIVQTDGKVLVAGVFTSANNIGRTGIARFNADGSVDQTFNPPDFVTSTGLGYRIEAVSITAIAVQSDGKIVVSGVFDRVNNQARKNLVRLNANGSLDTTFTLPYTAEEYISDVRIQPDGKIVYSGRVDTGSRNGLTRLNSDGSIDSNFFFNRLSRVDSFLIQPDGKFIINATTNSAEGVYRLYADGTRDDTFAAARVDRSVYKIALQSDGKVLLGGDFTTVNGVQQGKIARLNADGTLDTSFNTGGAGANATVWAIDVLQNGQIIIGGVFTTVNGVSRIKIAKLNSNGTLDATFNYSPGSSSTVYAVAATADGGVLLGGNDTQLVWSQISKLNVGGSLDTNFNAAIYQVGEVRQILNQPDGKVLVVGYFYRTNGIVKSGIVRLNQDGSIDSSFNSTISNAINAVALQPDGKILVASNRLYRLNSDGSTDSGFQLLSAGGTYGLRIEEIVVLSDGKIVVGGNLNTSGNTFVGVARLNANGSIDTTFNQLLITNNFAYFSKVTAVKFQPDGKIVIGGAFTTLNGVNRGNIARLNADGTLDTSFNSILGANNSVQDLALQSDGSIVLGGDFSSVNGIDNVYYLARLLPNLTLDANFRPSPNGSVYAIEAQPDNKILIGGVFDTVGGTTRTKLARINTNGTVDTSFTSMANDIVRDIYLQNDGKVLVGGDFNQIGGVYRVGIARLNSSTARTTFDYDGDGRADVSVFRPSNGAWYIQQSTAGFTGLQFGISTDKLVPADYDGDGKTDVAVIRSGTWYLQRSTAGFTGISFGDANDIPVPADYDGDGKAELAVFRPSNGYWYVLNLANNQFTATQFGQNGDKPVAADYDGDGKTDIAVNRNGNWYIQRSQLGFTGISFGDSNDKTVPADYDGDGKADIAVFRPSNGTWYLQQSTAGFTGIAFGLGTDIPVPADYDGDGKTDVAVVRNGNWYLNRTQAGFTGVQFGTSTDLPTPNSYVR